MAVVTAPTISLASPLGEHTEDYHGEPPLSVIRANSILTSLPTEYPAENVSMHPRNLSSSRPQRVGSVFHKIKHLFKHRSREVDSVSSTEASSLGLAGSGNQPSPAASGILKVETHTHSFLEQSMATIRSASFRKPRRISKIELIDETWEDWLEEYRKGENNLSEVERPTSFCGYGHMAPPIHAHETTRLRAVSKVSDHNFWASELQWLNLELRQVLAEFKMKSACVSIVDRSTQENMLEIGFGNPIGVFGRELSLDAHSILSSNYFVLLDASNDWRTRLNPLVHGPPFIKFYLGVPIKIDNMAVGCISVSDPYLKVNVPLKMIERLDGLSQKLTTRLQAKIRAKSTRRGLSRIQWDENPTEIDAHMEIFDYDSANLNESVPEENETCEQSSSEACSTNSSFSSLPQLQRPDNVYDISLPIYNARLQPLSSRSLIQPFQVFESLLKCQTVPQAIKKACKLVKQNLGADLVYIAEIRTKTEIKSNLLEVPTSSDSPASSSECPRNIHPPPLVHLVAHCKSDVEVNIEDQLKVDSKLLESAIASKFGVQYLAEGAGGNQYKAGLIIPFRRQRSRSAFSGGFSMAVFNARTRSISPGDKAFVKKVVSALENILQCNDELNSQGY